MDSIPTPRLGVVRCRRDLGGGGCDYGFLVISGGGIWQIPRNYLTSATVMPNLCNGCISIWRPITVVLYAVLGPRGFADVLGPVAPLNSVLNVIFLCAAWALVAVFSWRIPLTQKRLAYPGVFLILTFAGLVMSQLGLSGAYQWHALCSTGAAHSLGYSESPSPRAVGDHGSDSLIQVTWRCITWGETWFYRRCTLTMRRPGF